MYYIIESDKTFNQATADLETAISRNGYGLLHVHDIGATLRKKGEAFVESCKVYELCHPHHAAEVMSVDIRLNMALPCRISVFTDKGKTKIGMIQPTRILKSLSDDPALAKVADRVEADTVRMVNEAG